MFLLKSKYVTKTVNKTPYDLYSMLYKNGKEKADVRLCPVYQRDVVWKIEQYLKFMESIFRGIVPNPIIIMIDTKNNIKTVLDGKQRITTIKKFINNDIPYYEREENKIIIYWYDEIKNNTEIENIIKEIEDIKDVENRIITLQMKNMIENDIQLTIVQYNDLSYEQQVDIFNRLQYGVAISRGSFLKSLIKDENITSYIIEMADGYKEYFGKYAKDIKTDDHILYLIEIILMIDDEITQIKKTTVERKLKNMKMKKIKELDKNYKDLIEKMYSNKLLNKYNF